MKLHEYENTEERVSNDMVIGMIFTKIGNLIEKFKMQYVLHCLAEHGKNCHLEGKCVITPSTIHMGENVFIGGETRFFLPALIFISAITLCSDQMFRL